MDYERQNKWREWVKVMDEHCGSCANYQFEDERGTNKCAVYGKYYYMDDKCINNYKMSNEVSKSSGGCFLTTAACDYKGLPDDCYELQTMRRVRDEILLPTEYGKVIVKKYYEIAPGIVENIEKHPDREHILDYIFHEITAIVSYIEEDRLIEAVARYVELTYDVDGMTRKVDE